MSENIFVFVVCGAKEHIDTLHFSLQYLKRFSKNQILVLTDSSRNEIKVLHDNVIDIKTPEKYDHHQASIYLKTGIYQFVSEGNNYCYLDTDVIAFSEEVDEIFNEFVPPIKFAPDHCRMNDFSAYAVNCGCQEKWKINRDLFNQVMDKYDLNRANENPEKAQKIKALQAAFDELKVEKLKKLTTAVRYILSYPKFKLNASFYFDRKKRTWHDMEHNIVMYEVNVKKIEGETGFKYNRLTQKWINKERIDIWNNECHHLQDSIFEKFKIQVKDKKFQHWNGGVFLFNDDSHEFLENWFNYTMEIFEDPKWKTRDQGTLIATVWKFGLENHPVLDKKWNLIADFYNPYLDWKGDQNVQISANEIIQPKFMHVYHHFEDTNWNFWNQLMNHLKNKNTSH